LDRDTLRLMRLAAGELVAEQWRERVLSEAERIARLLDSRGLCKGWERVSKAMACLYAAARYLGFPLEPLEFAALVRRALLRRVREELRELEEVRMRSGYGAAESYIESVVDEEKRLILRASRGLWMLDASLPRMYKSIAMRVYGRSPPLVLPADQARHYAGWLRSVREGVPEGLEELSARAAAALTERAAGMSPRRVAFAGIIAASRLLGSPVTAEELARLFGWELVGRSRPGLRVLEILAEEALALLREDLEPRVVPQEAGE
jgi:transcription initiation factor TFIIIB Brf1 subunit/transcription initiation factor TFIIB